MTTPTAFLTLVAQTTPAAGAPPSFIQQLIASPATLMIGMFTMLYFLVIRPGQRQRKEMAARVASLQPGAKVVTTSGIYALVHSIKERSIVLKVAEGTMIEFDKSAIASIQPKESAEAKK
jgi:preprotein translocase subunit YajC